MRKPELAGLAIEYELHQSVQNVALKTEFERCGMCALCASENTMPTAVHEDLSDLCLLSLSMLHAGWIASLCRLKYKHHTAVSKKLNEVASPSLRTASDTHTHSLSILSLEREGLEISPWCPKDRPI